MRCSNISNLSFQITRVYLLGHLALIRSNSDSVARNSVTECRLLQSSRRGCSNGVLEALDGSHFRSLNARELVACCCVDICCDSFSREDSDECGGVQASLLVIDINTLEREFGAI